MKSLTTCLHQTSRSSQLLCHHAGSSFRIYSASQLVQSAAPVVASLPHIKASRHKLAAYTAWRSQLRPMTATSGFHDMRALAFSTRSPSAEEVMPACLQCMSKATHQMLIPAGR